MRWTMYGVLLAVASMARVASAQATRYSAFDLVGDRLTVTIPPGATAPAGTLSTFNCKLTTGASLVIERTADQPCNPIFAAPAPHDLVFDVDSGGRKSTFALELDRGTPSLQVAEYDADSRKLVLGNASVTGKVAAFVVPQERWQEYDVQGGKVTIAPSSQLARDTVVYFRVAKDRPIVKVSWRSADRPAQVAPTPTTFDEICAPAERARLASDNRATWQVLLDGTHRRLDVVKVVRAVDPNTWGIVFVSQPATSDAMLSADGTAGLAVPSMKDGSATSGSENPTWTRDAEPPICSWHLIAPRKPGPFKLTAKLVDPAARSTPLAQREIDVIVQERFAGAFRVGVAGILGAEDRKFEARTSPGSMQAEIVRTSHTPFEVVIGYSLFFDGGKGRRYLLRDDSDNLFLSHVGAFFGFGAVSATTTDIDFLKSLHAGLEVELTPNIAIAVTLVGRRLDQLSTGARVGGPAPSAIPLEQTYGLGAALVINLLPGFFKFAKGAK
jgi:hypothetical protein